jgi:hypothetical protein
MADNKINKIQEGEFVFHVIKTIYLKNLVEYYKVFSTKLSIDLLWENCVINVEKKKNLEVALLDGEPEKYYIIRTTYYGIVQKDVTKDIFLKQDQKLGITKKTKNVLNNTDLLNDSDPVITVKWYYREDLNNLLPGEWSEYSSDHYESMIVPMAKLKILTKQEMIDSMKNSNVLI